MRPRSDPRLSPKPSAFRRDDLFPTDSAVEGVDQHLNLDELAACALGLVPVERSGQHLGVGIPVLDHALTGFFQRFETLAHFEHLCLLPVTTIKMISVENRWKLALAEDNRRLVVVVSHFGIS